MLSSTGFAVLKSRPVEGLVLTNERVKRFLTRSPAYQSSSAIYLCFILRVSSYVFIKFVVSRSILECSYVVEFKMNELN